MGTLKNFFMQFFRKTKKSRTKRRKNKRTLRRRMRGG